MLTKVKGEYALKLINELGIDWQDAHVFLVMMYQAYEFISAYPNGRIPILDCKTWETSPRILDGEFMLYVIQKLSHIIGHDIPNIVIPDDYIRYFQNFISSTTPRNFRNNDGRILLSDYVAGLLDLFISHNTK